MTIQNQDKVVHKTITVERDLALTFRIWTEKIAAWWPTSHSLSGDTNTQVFIEGYVGGRFYERTSDGVEHQWGEVVVWEPPYHLAYTWRLGAEPGIPTRVDIYFSALDTNVTRINVEHRGPELIGNLWWQRNADYAKSWDHVLAAYVRFG